MIDRKEYMKHYGEKNRKRLSNYHKDYCRKQRIKLKCYESQQQKEKNVVSNNTPKDTPVISNNTHPFKSPVAYR